MGVESNGLGPNGNCWRYGKLLRAEDALNEAMHQAGAFAFDDRDLARAYSKAKKIDAPDYGWKTKADVETRKSSVRQSERNEYGRLLNTATL
ncbi:MAG: hypothetical protein IPK58_20750 [Acidobacteria bacterium]|nr:hypothetical protein [Acidobacteriota bacterium]